MKKNNKSKKLTTSQTHSAKSKGGGARGARGAAGPMNVGFLQELVDLMAANQMTTLEVKDGEQSILLKRGGEAPTGVVYASAPATSAPAPAAVPAAPTAPATPAKPVDETAGLVKIKSPMVGTFYASSSPDAKPFVSVGTAVTEDTDVCIIEAMKVFNNIKAETKGTVAKVLVTTGQTVEFGQTLFLVKP